MSWTDDMKTFAQEKWLDGWSASQVRAALNRANGTRFSRSAVIGMLHRLGARRGSVSAPAKVRKVARVPKSRPIAQFTHPAVRSAKVEAAPTGRGRVWPIPATAVRLLDLVATSCRYPVGEATGAEQLFCGAAKPAESGPYCAACAPRVKGKEAGRL